MNREAIVGCILGTAVGDALGLPYEGLGARAGTKAAGAAGSVSVLFRSGHDFR